MHNYIYCYESALIPIISLSLSRENKQQKLELFSDCLMFVVYICFLLLIALKECNKKTFVHQTLPCVCHVKGLW